ncbi:MAG TPA: glycoside hydrolase family 65, partial [Candidatus Sulfopaludibacter sp.]|nr:glycoside hydrolase family 65 [Candidatus Sulfopaludibacter sp.]
MPLSRRGFLAAVPASLAAQNRPLIDRRAMVTRHNPTLRAFDVRSPLSVGNGEFAFTADCTGLQTFPQLYEKTLPLCTQSQWGWHTIPNPSGKGPGDLRLELFNPFGRAVGYPTSSVGQKELFDWLRENPHRLHLGRIGFVIANPSEVAGISQTLDLWSGILRSEFQWNGKPITVET